MALADLVPQMYSDYATIDDPINADERTTIRDTAFTATTRGGEPDIPERAYYTHKRVRVMRQIFVVTLALFTGLFVMYMTYYYFIRVEIIRNAAQLARAAKN